MSTCSESNLKSFFATCSSFYIPLLNEPFNHLTHKFRRPLDLSPSFLLPHLKGHWILLILTMLVSLNINSCLTTNKLSQFSSFPTWTHVSSILAPYSYLQELEYKYDHVTPVCLVFNILSKSHCWELIRIWDMLKISPFPNLLLLHKYSLHFN